MSQSIWQLTGSLLHRQRRRAQAVVRYMIDCKRDTVLDVGCGEGYVTRFVSQVSRMVVGIDTNTSKIQEARKRLRTTEFICASVGNLPFKNEAFDMVCLLEVLEHLSEELQRRGLERIDLVLKEKGTLVISVPYKERITYSSNAEGEKIKPLFGHLHSMDEQMVRALLPPNYRLSRQTILPNLEMLSCSRIASTLPWKIWLLINHSLGMVKKGYWIILKYVKARYDFTTPYYLSIGDVKAFSDHYWDIYEKEYNRARAQSALSLLPSNLSHKRVLDIGCGGGFYSLAASKKGCVDLVLVDVSQVCVKSAKTNLQEETQLSPECLLAEATSLPFRDGDFDLILCIDLIEHVKKDRNLLRESRRVLGEYGLILLSTQNSSSVNYILEAPIQRYVLGNRRWMGWDSTHIRFYTPKRLLQLLRECGFIPRKVDGTYFVPYLLADGLRRFSQKISRIVSKVLLLINRRMERKHGTLWRLFGWGIMVLALRRE